MVYSTQQLGASSIITTPFRTRITDNHVNLLNCVTKTDIKNYVTIVNEVRDARIYNYTADNSHFINDSRVGDGKG